VCGRRAPSEAAYRTAPKAACRIVWQERNDNPPRPLSARRGQLAKESCQGRAGRGHPAGACDLQASPCCAHAADSAVLGMGLPMPASAPVQRCPLARSFEVRAFCQPRPALPACCCRRAWQASRMARRSGSVAELHAAISATERKQPRQMPARSSVQMRTQGDWTKVCSSMSCSVAPGQDDGRQAADDRAGIRARPRHTAACPKRA
jgi:hypothetical protein